MTVKRFSDDFVIAYSTEPEHLTYSEDALIMEQSPIIVSNDSEADDDEFSLNSFSSSSYDDDDDDLSCVDSSVFDQDFDLDMLVRDIDFPQHSGRTTGPRPRRPTRQRLNEIRREVEAQEARVLGRLTGNSSTSEQQPQQRQRRRGGRRPSFQTELLLDDSYRGMDEYDDSLRLNMRRLPSATRSRTSRNTRSTTDESIECQRLLVDIEDDSTDYSDDDDELVGLGPEVFVMSLNDTDPN